MNDRDFAEEEKSLREKSAAEEIHQEGLKTAMQQQEILHKYALGGMPLYPSQYAAIGITKAKNGFILSYNGSQFVFIKLEDVFEWIKAFYSK